MCLWLFHTERCSLDDSVGVVIKKSRHDPATSVSFSLGSSSLKEKRWVPERRLVRTLFNIWSCEVLGWDVICSASSQLGWVLSIARTREVIKWELIHWLDRLICRLYVPCCESARRGKCFFSTCCKSFSCFFFWVRVWMLVKNDQQNYAIPTALQNALTTHICTPRP